MSDNEEYTHMKSFTGGTISVMSEKDSVTGDRKGVTDDRHNTSDEKVENHISIASICIQNIFWEGCGHYGNGPYVVAFCDALVAISKCHEYHEAAFRVLLYLMGMTNKQMCIGVTMSQMMTDLSISEASARRAIKSLSVSQIICRTSEGSTKLYRLSDKILNPRVVVHGNTLNLNKKGMPHLLTPGGNFLMPLDTEFFEDVNGTDGRTANRISIATIHMQNIFVRGNRLYDQGVFVISFCDALVAIAKCSEYHETTFRVLLYLMGVTTKDFCLGVTFEDLVVDLNISASSVRRAIDVLTASQIICRKSDGGTNLYRLSDKLLNPRVAVQGNSMKLNKRQMPPLLTPGGGYLLPPDNEFYEDVYGTNVDHETGELLENF